MNMLNNLTAGNPAKMTKPIAYTLLANIVNIVPFGLSVAAVNEIFLAFSTPGGRLDTEKLWLISAVLLIYTAVMFLAEIPAYRASYRDAYELSAQGRSNLAEHIRKLPLGYLTGRDPGDLANMIMGDFAMIENAASHLIPQLTGALIMPVIAFLCLLFVDVKMALAMFIALPLAAAVLASITGFQKKLGKRHMQSKLNAANRLQEYLSGLRVMKAYNMTGEKFTRLETALRKLMKDSLFMEAALGPFVMLSVTFIKAGLTVMILAGAYLIAGGQLSLLTFVMFLIVGTRVFDPLSAAMYNFAELRYAEQAGSRILKLMRQKEMEGAKPPPSGHDIQFENVSFAYDTKPVLENLSLTMKPGTLTALVGPSGSGKTTVIRLAARFYDPCGGRILFGGADEKELDPEKLMQRMATVFQDVYLFQGTVADNIRFGKNSASDEEIKAAAEKARCHEFIVKLPKGYDTPVGEGGCTLSGGEKQRISIARALLKNAPVVLLDEATASLDPENETEVQKAINELTEGRTVIVIAHRLKTVRTADQICVLDRGRLAERGTHQTLLEAGGLYARMWNLQHRSEGWKLQ